MWLSRFLYPEGLLNEDEWCCTFFLFVCFVFSPPKHTLVKQLIIRFCGGATSKYYSLYSEKLTCESFLNLYQTLREIQINTGQVAGCGAYIFTKIKDIVCCYLCNNRETNSLMICQHSFEKEIHLSSLDSLN